jgi:uncharacterized membrane protein
MGVLDSPQVRNHVPLLGRGTGVQVALLPKSIRVKPVDQVLYIGGFVGTSKITGATATSAYVNVVAGTAYTVTAGTTDTKKSIAYKLIDLINTGTPTHGCTAQNPRLSGTDWIYDVYNPLATFTLANTGTTTVGDVVIVATAGNTTAVAKGATSITVLKGLEGAIQKGQFMQAVDKDGTEYLIQLAATAAVAATSLSVVALDEGIPAGSQIGYPVEFFDRTSADSNETANTAEFTTFNSGGKTDGVVTSTATEGNLGGNFFERCPGASTAEYASANGFEVWLKFLDPEYRTGWTRRTQEGAAVITSRNKSRPVDGFVSNELSYKFYGQIIDTPSKPLY